MPVNVMGRPGKSARRMASADAMNAVWVAMSAAVYVRPANCRAPVASPATALDAAFDEKTLKGSGALGVIAAGVRPAAIPTAGEAAVGVTAVGASGVSISATAGRSGSIGSTAVCSPWAASFRVRSATSAAGSGMVPIRSAHWSDIVLPWSSAAAATAAA